MKEVKETLKEVSVAVIPITAVVLALQLTLVKMPPTVIGQFIVGAAFVFSGLFFFLYGVNLGLLPMGA